MIELFAFALATSLATLEHDHYVIGTVPADRFTALHTALAERVLTLETAVGSMATSTDIGPLVALVNSREAWDDAPVALRRELVAAVVDDFTLQSAPSRGSLIKADRLIAAWAT